MAATRCAEQNGQQEETTKDATGQNHAAAKEKLIDVGVCRSPAVRVVFDPRPSSR